MGMTRKTPVYGQIVKADLSHGMGIVKVVYDQFKP